MYNRRRVIGILAHVDAGKTTLAEAFFYLSGAVRKAGRVDHQDAFLDHFVLERERGITIFSKQALFQWKDLEFTLLDTPGHVDFSAEMERTLQVLDYAILVVSGADGVQGHTLTLWGLLKRYGIPTFLFVNKMDQQGTDKEKLLSELRKKLDEACVDFSGKFDAEFFETVSLCREPLMEEYLETGTISKESIGEAVAERELFPTFFGSALKIWGVEELLDGLAAYALAPEYPESFGARVFKISRDKQGNRLTHVKVTGGTLAAKQFVGNGGNGDDGKDGAAETAMESGGEFWQEKVDQIRLYNGATFQTLQEAEAGTICALTGLSRTFVGQGLGYERENAIPSLEPVMTYRLRLPAGSDPVIVLGYLRRLQEEEPLLRVVWKETVKEIHVSVMGEVQVEILKSLLLERHDLEVEFEDGSIVYKETLAEPVLGVGHFEPLKHYAEVQLLLEPGERGSGLQFAACVSEDALDKNWQRLILTHLEERTHPGVLTGSEVTDLRISIVGGRAHVKHTEGGDFRQATYRALRQGLRSGKSILLEPVFEFMIEMPADCLGRAMTDVTRMNGSFEPPVMEGETAILTGTAPVAAMRDYQREVISYTKGMGRLSCVLKGYEPCREPEGVIQSMAYDPEGDLENPTGSVFCSHGAGYVVPWNEVGAHAHLPLREDFLEAARRWQGLEESEDDGKEEKKGWEPLSGRTRNAADRSRDPAFISQEEIDAIFAQGRRNQNRKESDRRGYRRYHRGNRRESGAYGGASAGSGQTGGAGRVRTSGEDGSQGPRNVKAKALDSQKENCILVDGYNVIFAWPQLRELMQVNVASARDRLIDEMSNYQGYVGGTLILVYDAYKVKGNPGSVQKINNIYVVYTKEAETADQYIEKTVHEMASKFRVTVATSDGLEQMIIWGEGATRMSSLGLLEDLERQKQMAREKYGITEH